MIYEIKADRLSIKVSSKGAELQSMKRQDGTELLWQGDAKYWDGQSPLLFPFPGKSWDNKLRIDGAEYTMPKHGFASNMEFEMTQQEGNSITFRLTDTKETYEMYPYHFVLEVTYTIVGSSLNVSWKVTNRNTGMMYFMIGAHPAFNLPNFREKDKIHGYICTMDAPDMQSNVVLPDGYCHDEVETVVLEDGLLPITNTTFDCDTILDQTGRFREVILTGKHKEPLVRVNFRMPVLAIWAPNGGNAPFVCIEPWHGICDRFNDPRELKDRNHIISLTAGDTWSHTYTITAI
ncbi:MAG: aldose 1-epimerase family protein [Bacteroidaceae bacterium]|nr:aldose 1-epimerase family protein [Bacteroidaceae bacterium]